MKLRPDKLTHPSVVPPPPKVAKAQPEADFTAEGSPPPGKVGAGQPALPGAELPVPADAGTDGVMRGKR